MKKKFEQRFFLSYNLKEKKFSKTNLSKTNFGSENFWNENFWSENSSSYKFCSAALL